MKRILVVLTLLAAMPGTSRLAAQQDSPTAAAEREEAELRHRSILKKLEGLEESVAASQKNATALHEACHAFIAYRVRKHLVIDIATIEKGSNYLGMVSSIKPEDLFTEWRSEYEADIMVSIASLVGERMFFEGDSSSGVSSDLWSATMLATYMEKHWGMGATVSTEGHDMGARVERLLKHLADETEKLLKENRSKVLALTHALETYKTLDGTDVAAVLEGTQGPIVDGRPYYLEQSIKMIEEYHCKMVKLQQDYDKQLVPVPKLPELTEGSLILTPENGLGPNGNGRKPTFKQEASAKLGGNYL